MEAAFRTSNEYCTKSKVELAFKNTERRNLQTKLCPTAIAQHAQPRLAGENLTKGEQQEHSEQEDEASAHHVCFLQFAGGGATESLDRVADWLLRTALEAPFGMPRIAVRMSGRSRTFASWKLAPFGPRSRAWRRICCLIGIWRTPLRPAFYALMEGSIFAAFARA